MKDRNRRFAHLKFIAVEKKYYCASDWSRLRRRDAMKALLKSRSAEIRFPRGPAAKEIRRLLLEAIKKGFDNCIVYC